MHLKKDCNTKDLDLKKSERGYCFYRFERAVRYSLKLERPLKR